MKREESLKGLITKENAAGIKNVLEEAKADGHRFVSFDPMKGALKPEQLNTFKSAMPALEFAVKQTSEQQYHIVRSVAVMEKEVDRVQENRKSKTQENGMELTKEEKRSKGQEMSR